MASPVDPGALVALVRGEQTGEAVALEESIAAAALGGADDDFTRLQRRTLAAWTAAFGGPATPARPGDALRRILAAVRAAVRRILDALGPRAQQALDASLHAASAMGVRQHAAYASAARGRRTLPLPVRVPDPVRRRAAGLAEMVTERRDRALSLLTSGRIRRWSDIAAAIGVAQGTPAAVRTRISDAVAEAVNAAAEREIRALGAQKMWVTEEDACVSCLAYAGLTTPPGGSFPGGLSWDPAQRDRTDPIPYPPRHPNCRCRIVAFIDTRRPPGAPSMPEVLRREAERDIARGSSPTGESRPARLRAAAELRRTRRPVPAGSR